MRNHSANARDPQFADSNDKSIGIFVFSWTHQFAGESKARPWIYFCLWEIIFDLVNLVNILMRLTEICIHIEKIYINSKEKNNNNNNKKLILIYSINCQFKHINAIRWLLLQYYTCFKVWHHRLVRSIAIISSDQAIIRVILPSKTNATWSRSLLSLFFIQSPLTLQIGHLRPIP